MKIAFLVGGIAFFSLITSCGSGPQTAAPVPAQVQVAAQAPAPAFGPDELDAAVRETSDYLNKQLPKGNKLVILNIQSEFPALSEYIIDELIANTVNDRIFSVVDRNQLNTIRAELDFQMSGEVDDKTAQALGRIAGAQIIISGAASRIGDLYRMRIRALTVENAQITGQFNRNIPEGKTIIALVNSRATGYGDADPRSPARTAASPMAPVGTQPGTSTASSTQRTSASPIRFTITYNTNRATGRAPSEQTVQNGENIIIPDKGEMTYARAAFGGWNTKPDGTGTSYTAGDTFVVTANTQLYAQWIEQIYRIGDTGPAGGLVFYDKGNNSSGWRYMEVSKNDFGKAPWGRDLVIRTPSAMGTGKQNTQELAKAGGMAAMLCEAYRGGGFSDWFLPSKDELNFIYINLVRINQIIEWEETYWSSSYYSNGIFDIGEAAAQRFSDGTQVNAGRGNSYKICAVRQF